MRNDTPRHPVSPLGGSATLVGLLGAALLALAPVAAPFPGSEGPAYLDPGQPVAVRADDLLGRMTLEEKLGQINMPCVYEPRLGPDDDAKKEACRRFAEGTYELNAERGENIVQCSDDNTRRYRTFSVNVPSEGAENVDFEVSGK